MVQYRLLDSDGLIEEAVRSFASLPAIAVDFEGEFNLHIYGEHLCLVQIYAGGTYYVIDPRSASVTKAGLEAFFSSDVEKVWFECHSDETLVYKSYGLRIRNIYDIRVPAKLLGYDGNLLSLEESLLGVVPSFSKKKNQTANWLRRPIPPEQMEYALADVAHLLELKDVLERKIAEEGLEDECSRQMKAAMVMKPPVPGWKKLPGWKRFSRKEKAYAKWIFIARDKVAERFNVPPAHVMDKHLIASLAANPPDAGQLPSAIRPVPPRFYSFMLDSMKVALERAAEESGKGA